MNDNANNRALATLGVVNPESDQFLDFSMYDKAINATSADWFDYFSCRVVNNPQYSELMKLEMYDYENPRYQSVAIIGEANNIEQVQAGQTMQSLESNSRHTPRHTEQLQFSELVEAALEKIKSHPRRDNLIKTLAFWIVQAGNVDYHHPLLNKYIKLFREPEYLEVRHHRQELGSNHASQRDRTTLREIFTDVLRTI